MAVTTEPGGMRKSWSVSLKYLLTASWFSAVTLKRTSSRFARACLYSSKVTGCWLRSPTHGGKMAAGGTVASGWQAEQLDGRGGLEGDASAALLPPDVSSVDSNSDETHSPKTWYRRRRELPPRHSPSSSSSSSSSSPSSSCRCPRGDFFDTFAVASLDDASTDTDGVGSAVAVAGITRLLNSDSSSSEEALAERNAASCSMSMCEVRGHEKVSSWWSKRSGTGNTRMLKMLSAATANRVGRKQFLASRALRCLAQLAFRQQPPRCAFSTRNGVVSSLLSSLLLWLLLSWDVAVVAVVAAWLCCFPADVEDKASMFPHVGCCCDCWCGCRRGVLRTAEAKPAVSEYPDMQDK
ncbi:hypothetical protein CAOG_009749 [Capsaspora owczarzaki ATCC 30864]|uniref:Uncharacterized protein n=1 Tax=Capsaspora owczarzaki (strain ATCC 30864) TaxID=595528 RepID=A0A0D2WPM2_CAPO3|nr:hypothetical protein CAOG_009749 [Capsaspora owczarzaki ATCC 30864]